MFRRVKFFHIRKAAKDTYQEVSTFSRFFWLVLVVIFNWTKGFSAINKTYSFFIPKIVVIIIGSIFTGIPFYFLLPIAFLPTPVVAPVFFVAFIVALAHF